MQQILSFFWQMCLLRETPARLPTSQFVLGLILGLYTIVAIFAVTIGRPDQTLTGIFGTVLVGIFYQGFVTLALLVFRRSVRAFIAAWSALLGTNAIMLLILIPVNLILLNAGNSSLILLADSVSWVCFGWWLAIAGFIYHKTAGISMLQGSAIAFIAELLSVMTTVTLFPGS